MDAQLCVLLSAALLLRLALLCFGVYQDQNLQLKYTDVDYHVFTDASRFMLQVTHTHTHTHTLSLSHTRTHSLSLSHTHTHAHSLSLSLSLSLSHTHTRTHSNQIKSLLLSHHHSTSALVSEILMSVLQTVQKNNRQFTYGQTVQKKKKKPIYIWTDSAKNCTGAFTVLQTVQKKKKQQQQFTYGQYIFTDCTEDNVLNTHTYTQFT